jgi:thiol-disulfide isomerase/thioredoxin
MSKQLSVIIVLTAAVVGGSFVSKAQTAPPLPGCEPAPEVRKIIDDQLNPVVLAKIKFPERFVLERQVLEDLITRYPRELAPYEILNAWMYPGATHEETLAFQDRLLKMAKDNPDDPLALLLGGEVLVRKDTPEAIRMFEAAKAKAPNFPWPARQLAQLYMHGKRADPIKEKENTEAFFAICPAYTSAYISTDTIATWLLQKDLPLLPKTAAALRARLEKDTDPKRLEDYETLWGREFLLRQPKEFDAVRAQIAQDLKRLEAVNPKGDAEWRAFLISGYRQSGASTETLTAMEDRLLREYPQSDQAYYIVRGRWYTAHKAPEDQNDAAAWARYYKESEEATKGWIHDYPDNTFLQRGGLFSVMKEDDAVSEQDGIAALDIYLQSFKDYKGANMMSYYDDGPADFLMDRGWQPARALDILKQDRAAAETDRAKGSSIYGDNTSDDELKRFEYFRLSHYYHADGLLLKAAMLAGQPEEALKLRSSIEAPPPTDKALISDYWWNRARFEAIQKHTLDALAYYHLAVDSRTETPKPYHGKLRDDLTDEAHALWKAQGGTEAAWAVWSKPPSGITEQAAETPWKKPTNAIPAFELSDLSGKTWRLKELEGKTVLITLWATWCGPCRLELPRLQKFYEKVKNRSDIQVLTFDLDEDPGLVAPFLKEKGYTFPVLPAFSMEEAKGAIPENWVVDPHGIWRWVQIGYDEKTDAEFEKEMLERLDAAKAGQ